MTRTDLSVPVPTAARPEASTLFAALELSGKSWLVATSAPGEAKISKRTVTAGDGLGLLALLSELCEKAERRLGWPVRVVVIQEAGLDGFWLHRLLEAKGLESPVVDPASIAVDRRQRRRKTDAIDVEGLRRTLMAWARGERRVCSMVRPPSPEDEDRRRLSREREALIAERIRHTNRIKGLLAGQGITGFEPRRPAHRDRLDALTTGDGRPLPPRLKDEIRRPLARLDAVIAEIKAVEAERDALVGARPAVPEPAVLLVTLKGIGPEFATGLWLEALFRSVSNRRQIAAYAGLAPAPWQSGGFDRDQGIAKAGNPRRRKTMIQVAWLWLRHQPDSTLSRWFTARVGTARGRVRRIAIVAVARKLLVALWRFVTQGIVPEGAVLKACGRERGKQSAGRFRARSAGLGGRWPFRTMAARCRLTEWPRPSRAPRPRG
jgi:transposase